MSLRSVEKNAVKSFKEQEDSLDVLPETLENLVFVAIKGALEVGKQMQEARKNLDKIKVTYKEDGTRQTNIDCEAESLFRFMIANLFPDHLVVGEEDGGELEREIFCWCVDPIDSTNTFLTYENTTAVSISLFYKGEVVLGLVYNPFTGELFYTIEGEEARLLVEYPFDDEVSSFKLPLKGVEEEEYDFVNVHPVPRNNVFSERLKKARAEGKIDKVLEKGGSPAYSIADITKGHFSAVMNWGEQEAEPWDLAGAIKIVETAGGVVTGINGEKVELGHKGLIVASISKKFHNKLLDILKGEG